MRPDNPRYKNWLAIAKQIKAFRDITISNQPGIDKVTIENYASVIVNYIWGDIALSMKTLRTPKKFVAHLMADDETNVQTKKTILSAMLSYSNYTPIRKAMRVLTVDINNQYETKGYVGKKQDILLKKDVQAWYRTLVQGCTDKMGYRKWLLFWLLFMNVPRRNGAYNMSAANKNRMGHKYKHMLVAGTDMSAGRCNFLDLTQLKRDPQGKVVGETQLILNTYKTCKIYGRVVIPLREYKVYNVYELDTAEADTLLLQYRDQYYKEGEPVFEWGTDQALKVLKQITCKRNNFNIVRKSLATYYILDSRRMQRISYEMGHTLKTHLGAYLLQESYDEHAAEQAKVKKENPEGSESSVSEDVNPWEASKQTPDTPSPPSSDSESDVPTPAPVRKRMNTRPRRRVAPVVSYSRSHR
jgi:hypothetical protein